MTMSSSNKMNIPLGDTKMINMRADFLTALNQQVKLYDVSIPQDLPLAFPTDNSNWTRCTILDRIIVCIQNENGTQENLHNNRKPTQ